MTISRRRFLQGTCAATAATFALPKWLAAGPASAAASATDTILVIVQMSGGNDGLNTVVPINDPIYRTARPRVSLTPSQTLRVDDRTGFHPNLTSLYAHLNAGRLAVIQGVGYPAPDLSHFRSMDIWQSAIAERQETSGWISRALDSLYSKDVTTMHALALGYDIPTAFQGGIVPTPVVADPAGFDFFTDPYWPADDAPQRAAINALFAQLVSRRHAARPLPAAMTPRNEVSKTGSHALAESKSLRSAMTSYQTSIVYPNSDLGNGLKMVSAVINANIGPRIYWVTQEGYDTHDTQRGTHDALLLDLDRSIGAFWQDIQLHNLGNRVVVMTWSEFGRRVEDNASGGTDHGTAGPLFLLGSRIRGGLYGTPPSLSNLDEDGNLRYNVDFRQVYASVLANWIGADPELVLQGRYTRLPIL
jgi:uncharacterized protein (DUF1501 family)